MTSALQRVQKNNKRTENSRTQLSQEQGLHATCETKVVYLNGWLLECTVSPGARSNPSCFSAADRVIGVIQLHTSDAKHLPPQLLVTGVTKHDSNSRLKTWNVTSYIKHYTATKEHSLLSQALQIYSATKRLLSENSSSLLWPTN